MRRSKVFMSMVIFAAIATLVFAMMLVGCAPQQVGSSSSKSNETSKAVSAESGAYVSDE